MVCPNDKDHHDIKVFELLYIIMFYHNIDLYNFPHLSCSSLEGMYIGVRKGIITNIL